MKNETCLKEKAAMAFPLEIFRFRTKALTPIVLPPYKGSTLRGGFGNAFKKVVCALRNQECGQCLLKEKCVYSYVFETPPPNGSHILRKYEKAPHPFVIEPPLETKKDYPPGESLEFGIVLIGKAVDYLPYFIYAFEELGKMGIGKGRGRYELLEVRNGDRLIYESGDKKLKAWGLPPIPSGNLPDSRVKTDFLVLNFLTPIRIIVDGKLVAEPEFHHLIRNLLRRISSLSYFHCDSRLDLDFKGLIKRAAEVKVKDRAIRWHDWERYSARQDVKMKMGGFLGRVCFEGDLDEYLPFLELGEFIHMGKATSFGLGKYKILNLKAEA